MTSNSCIEIVTFIQDWIWPIVASIVTVVSIYLFQKPRIALHISDDDKTNVAFGGKFVHLVVENKSKGILGGVSANHCKGIIKVHSGNGQEKEFITKWASQRDPISMQYLPISNGQMGGITTVDLIGIEECKYENFFPGERKKLDVAMKMDNDTSCYIHEPENFLPIYPNRKNPKNGYGPGKFFCEATIACSNTKSNKLKFYLLNDGQNMDGLTLKPYTKNKKTNKP